MRIGLQTWGTEGDIRPFFALASALSKRGHEVRLVTTSVEGREFSALERASGVPEEPAGTAHLRALQGRIAEGARENLRNKNPIKQLDRILADALDPVSDAMVDAGKDLASWASFLVVHIMAFQATTAAEAAGRPFACVSFAPLFPTNNYPPIGAPRLGRLLNPALWWIVAKAMDGILRGRVARVRERAGLPEDRDAVARMLKRARLGLLAMSPRLLPRATDWDEWLHVPGFLEIHEDGAQAALTPELSAFLAAGPAPAFFSTGSMANLEPERAMTAARAMIEAARALGLRVVVQVPEAAREGLPGGPDVVVIARAPHALLFPRCAVLVHHGGAGTTHAALRAGRPSIIVPHIADQFFWGDLLHRRGVAGAPLPIGSLDSRSLGSRLRKVTENNAFQERAAALARELAVEDGATAACDLIERAAR